MPQSPSLERAAAASQGADAAVKVTTDNFCRAESDMYFGNAVRDAGGVGRLLHHREPMPIDAQSVIRPNRDTLYSAGVFDLDAGPVTVTLPDAGGRFMSLMVTDEDEYVHDVIYDLRPHTFTRDQIGTRYVLLAVRTLVDPDDPADLAKVHALQDEIEIERRSVGAFEVPSWDPVSQKSVREALLALGEMLPDTRQMFGARDKVDPVRHLIGSATGWGGNPETEALYLMVTPEQNDGRRIYRLSVPADVPVDGFWSISVYNKAGYFEPNPHGVYSLNDVTAKKEPDGSVEVQFGGCDGASANCIPITPGWNYLVRLYRPRAAILTGGWSFPEARPVQ